MNNLEKLAPIKDIFVKESEILAVYVFGSHASGKVQPESDIDIGIVSSSTGYLKDNKLRLLGELVKKGYDKVDLVELDSSDITLSYEVLKHNSPIYLRHDFDHADFFPKQ